MTQASIASAAWRSPSERQTPLGHAGQTRASTAPGGTELLHGLEATTLRLQENQVNDLERLNQRGPRGMGGCRRSRRFLLIQGERIDLMSEQVETPVAVMARRHDLDALRGFAMLLGIALHAAMSFSPPWGGPPHDIYTSRWFGTFMTIIHGFRLQLFFVVSGFFTMMLWRKRGTLGVIKQRTTRILVPCLLGIDCSPQSTAGVYPWADRRERARHQEDDAAGKQARPNSSNSPLPMAVLKGDLPTVRRLVAEGADVNRRDENGSTPLHAAAFLGRYEIAVVLLEHGADPNAKANDGNPPISATFANWDLTRYLCELLQVPLDDCDAIEAGREKVRQLLTPKTKGFLPAVARADTPAVSKSFAELRDAYFAFFRGPSFNITVLGVPVQLVTGYTFSHLWFLWFLCWITPAFVIVATLMRMCRVPGPPHWLMMTPACLVWLVPLTLLPQCFFPSKSFGPDTCLGILPMPHLLVYYSVFFAFGALYYDVDDAAGRLGRWWWLALPLALCVLYPLAQVWMQDGLANGVIQVLYAWLLVFGMMGLFRTVLKRESTVFATCPTRLTGCISLTCRLWLPHRSRCKTGRFRRSSSFR